MDDTNISQEFCCALAGHKGKRTHPKHAKTVRCPKSPKTVSKGVLIEQNTLTLANGVPKLARLILILRRACNVSAGSVVKPNFSEI